MVGMEFFGDVDLASVAIWMFWVFFALLIYYLQTENMREGYPLENDDGTPAPSTGLFPMPKDKTFILRDGRGTLTVPRDARKDRAGLALERTAAPGGSPLVAMGDPMEAGVGPAAWAERRDVPELDAHGAPKIRPMSQLEGFSVSGGRDPRGKAVVAGDGEVVGRVVDMLIDVPEAIVRYLKIDLNPEGSGNMRLAPMGMVRVQSDRVTVRSLYSHNFEGIPKAASPDQVTLLEEEKIMAWYAGGTLYADPKRAEPVL